MIPSGSVWSSENFIDTQYGSPGIDSFSEELWFHGKATDPIIV
jgi:hypothetical protein